jgi:predicted house-cleaning noncanonical NTP pyrophosphatase (MazG superfamily)
MARARRTSGSGARGSRSERIARLSGETKHQHRLRSYAIRHPGTTRQQARGHGGTHAKSRTAAKLHLARLDVMAGMSATAAAKRHKVSRETVARSVRSDPNIVKRRGRWVDIRLERLAEYKQKIEREVGDGVVEFFEARSLEDQLTDLDTADALHDEYTENGGRPLGYKYNLFILYH